MPDANATVREVIAALDSASPEIGYVCGRKGRVKPEELWLPSISTWLRADGWSYNGDMGRGYVYPVLLDRWRLRRAVRRWERNQNAPIR